MPVAATPSLVAPLDAAFLRQLAEEITPAGVAEMIGMFLEDAPARMAAIRRGMADRAVQAVRQEAHALAGAACIVGLRRLSEAARALQLATEREGPDEAHVEALAAALGAGLPAVAHWAEHITTW